MTESSNESSLSRWSRRKLEVQQQENEQNQLAQLETTDSPGEALAVAVETEVETPVVLTDADMPAIETLGEDSDFTGFMSRGVSDKLRNLALRKLFNTAEFNIRDGLDEYDEDYTYFEKLGDIVTCDMKHQIELEEQKLRDALEQEVEETEDIEDIEDLEEVAEEGAVTAAEADPVQAIDQDIEPVDDSPPDQLLSANTPTDKANKNE
jgi:hypothetical protein